MTLSRKTKPLGPRQRKAYVAPFIAAVATAKAEVAARTAEAAAADRARDKLVSIPVVLRRTTGEMILASALDLGPGYYSGGLPKTPAEKRAFRKRVVDGEVKIGIGGGSSAAKSLTSRVRRMTGPDTRKLARLDALIARTIQQRKDHIAAAYEGGVPYTIDSMVDAVMTARMLPHVGYIDTYAVNRAESALESALAHDGTKSCNCQPCGSERQFDARAAANRVARKREEAREEAENRRILRKAPLSGEVSWHCDGCDTEQLATVGILETDEGPLPGVECHDCEYGRLLDDGVGFTAAVAPGQEALIA